MRSVTLIASLLFLFPVMAWGAEADVYCLTGTSSTGAPIFMPASPQHPCPTIDVGPGGGTGAPGVTITNKSATITLGGATNQIAIAANTARVSCHVQPQGGDLWISPGATTALDNPSEFLPALSEWTCPLGYKGAVGIAGATTAAKFYADEGTVP